MRKPRSLNGFSVFLLFSMVSAIWKITTFVKKLHEKTLSANQITDELQMKCAKIKRDAAAL
jgi:hypothetical protein